MNPAAIPPRVYFAYEGEGLCLYWKNPWDGKEEKIAYFLWPAHPPEETARVEKIFETIADMACGNHTTILQQQEKRLLAEVQRARAGAFEEVKAECRRKAKINDMSDRGIGHSAQSFGQVWAYENIIEWCEAKAQAAGGEKV